MSFASGKGNFSVSLMKMISRSPNLWMLKIQGVSKELISFEMLIAESMQIKLNRLIVEKNKSYSPKFQGDIRRYVDFMNNFKSFQYAHHSTISSDAGSHPDSFVLYRQAYSLNFFCHIIYIINIVRTCPHLY